MSDTALKEFEEQQLAVINPLKAKSLDLNVKAKNILIVDDASLAEANKVKKELNAHNKDVKDLRLELTRPLDSISKQLIAAERDILAPITEGKDALGKKILAYDEEQERIRVAEVERVDGIVAEIESLYMPGMTENQVTNGREMAKHLIVKLSAEDREKSSIKLALMTLSNRFTERMNDIEIEKQRASKQKLEDDADRIERENRRIAAEQERQNLEKQRQAEEEEAAKAEKARPKSNIVERTDFEITDPEKVNRSLCSPDEKKIRAFLKDNPDFPLEGIRVFKVKSAR